MEAYKQHINSLDNEYMIKLFGQEVETVKPQGYGIFYNGQRIKPIRGNVDHYPSVNAALDAMERNSKAHMDIKKHLMFMKYGWNWETNMEAYKAYFYNPDTKEGFSGGYKNDTVYQEYKDLSKAASNAMKHFIKQWLKEGRLEIKLI